MCVGCSRPGVEYVVWWLFGFVPFFFGGGGVVLLLRILSIELQLSMACRKSHIDKKQILCPKARTSLESEVGATHVNAMGSHAIDKGIHEKPTTSD